MRISLPFVILTVSAFGNTDPLTTPVHIVGEGDTLSEIAQKYFGGPVYDSNGSLEKLLDANANLKNPDRIFIGDQIILTPRIVGDQTNSIYHEQPAMQQEESVVQQEQPALQQEQPAVQEEPLDTLPQEPESSEIRPTFISEKIKFVNTLEIFGGYQLTSLSMTDVFSGGSAGLLSAYDFRVGATWARNWNENKNLFLTLNMRSLQFLDWDNPDRPLVDASKVLSGISGGVLRSLSGQVVTGLGASMTQQLFVYGLPTGPVRIDGVFVPELCGFADYEFYGWNRSVFTYRAQLSYLPGIGSNDYAIHRGLGFKHGVTLTRQHSDMLFSFSMGYEFRKQNTSLVSFSEHGIFSQFSLWFPIFESQPQ